MDVRELPIDGARAIVTVSFADDRGYFTESYARTRYREAGILDDFVQDNLSLSTRDVLRGLHGDRRMTKLVGVVAGSAFDVLVDVRPGSPTFGRWHGEILRADRRVQLYIPAGCLHGFLALEPGTLLAYKQSAEYDPASEFGIAWNDPDLAIAWPLDGRSPLLSPKDARNPTMREAGLL